MTKRRIDILIIILSVCFALQAQDLTDSSLVPVFAKYGITQARMEEYNQFFLQESPLVELYCTQICKYDAAGNILEDKYTYALPDRLPYSYIVQYKYRNNKLSEVIKRSRKDDALVWRHKYFNKKSQVLVHEMDAYGTLIYKNYYNKDSLGRDTLIQYMRMPKLQVIMSVKRIYDSFGLFAENTYTYQYDSLGNQIPEWFRSKTRVDNIGESMSTKQTYIVSEGGKRIETQICYYNDMGELSVHEYIPVVGHTKRVFRFFYTKDGLPEKVELETREENDILEVYTKKYTYK